MKKLDLGFRSATKGSMHHLQLKFINSELDDATVKKAMQELAALKMFTDKNGDLVYGIPVSATYVDTTDKVLFNDDAKK
ncbi:DUF2922 domain-containing protein [Ligilactobacillus apodemi]|uniref:DUF2922 domain-containing protein n=1 Tax=Ligilactobacillus apodemi DSM 16634 = JCM 16172 TaxID=1423724 RepID=A0A0R1U1S6_9LACO|nr:DUF2922 domain-containing protein [Ligilactobacillus apodemi]KRL87329.1 hypothetical protein FC32_GL001753 [Ligilactobacillus apodemi DSM 16634 = JCM 16172]MCR1901741.1 DUF2922 domain-containing protein [Ligilactobacillus apodemi]